MQKLGLTKESRDANRNFLSLSMNTGRVVVVADEAHRTQYDLIDRLAAISEMRPTLPPVGFGSYPYRDYSPVRAAIFGEYVTSTTYARRLSKVGRRSGLLTKYRLAEGRATGRSPFDFDEDSTRSRSWPEQDAGERLGQAIDSGRSDRWAEKRIAEVAQTSDGATRMSRGLLKLARSPSSASDRGPSASASTTRSPSSALSGIPSTMRGAEVRSSSPARRFPTVRR